MKKSNLQLDLELRSAMGHELFPGRSLLRVGEVAEAWAVTPQHVVNLVEAGDLLAIDLRSSSPVSVQAMADLKAHRSVRSWLRIPVSAFDQFTKSRISQSRTK